MKALAGFVRTSHWIVIGPFSVMTCTFLVGAAFGASWPDRAIALLAFLVLGAPLLLLAQRLLHNEHPYPPRFLHSHPRIAMLLAVLSLVSAVIIVLAASGILPDPTDLPMGQRLPGVVAYGAGAGWLTLLSLELLFRDSGQHDPLLGR